MLPLKKAVAAAVLLLMLAQVKGQEIKKLRIGDPAPEIKYSKSLKGTPITSFKGEQLYIVELWATWCPACISVMPHLTKLQKQYQEKATFISVNIGEKIKMGQPYESCLRMVTRFVQANSAKMGYPVIVDNNDKHMANNWHIASGKRGLPATYIIKDEKLIWVGHPLQLDTLLPKIFDGSYDMAAYKAQFDKQADATQKTYINAVAIIKPLEDAMAAKEYKRALQLIEKIKSENPWTLDNKKFNALLRLDEKDAINFAGQWQKTDESARYYIYEIVSQEDNLSKSTYLWAAKLYEEHFLNSKHFPMFFHELASTYAKGGNYQKAITLQDKAIEDAKADLVKHAEKRDAYLIGLITEDTIAEYEEALAGYKKAGKLAKK